ncbi:hypothetical protein EJ04DRAFT_515324 [Polyplosphaeria fusca]|uniref:Uncharacterized protein n=1 Tax=Polyplosphaeria fusca TaxID=682080 RepID=A0A9P4QSK8_9PLEO|nr:hypothetical protein EJ04DRAFT_515324 [Polyplosphaeria fusca]
MADLREQWLIALPYVRLFVVLLAKALTLLVPLNILTSLVQFLLRFPRDAAHVTASFVASPQGVRQALYMAHDEMLTITTDKWDDEIWGAAHATKHPHARPALRFLFAKSDHWVANETRNELIRARGRGLDGEEWKPKMEVDETGEWPHGFCIRHGVPVAERVKDYVEEIVEGDV